MHPLLAASLINSFSNERVSAAKTRRTAKAAKTGGPGDGEASEVIIRRASATDVPALVRLSALDSDHRAGRLLAAAADEGVVIVAEVDGELRAARSVDDGVSVANPFRPSAPHRQLLALRASQLGGAEPQRSRRVRLRVLRPHTS
jgi:hypothetical protein